MISWIVWYFPSAQKEDIKPPKAAIFIDLIKPSVEVSFHVSAKCKAENELPITEKLKISFFLKVLCNQLFVFCFALCAHIERHPYASIRHCKLRTKHKRETRQCKMEKVFRIRNKYKILTMLNIEADFHLRICSSYYSYTLCQNQNGNYR